MDSLPRNDRFAISIRILWAAGQLILCCYCFRMCFVSGYYDHQGGPQEPRKLLAMVLAGLLAHGSGHFGRFTGRLLLQGSQIEEQ